MSQSEKPAASAPLNETLSWEPVETRDLTGKKLGDFQVERMLGRGGMGEVYLARQISLNRPVALKVLRPDLLTKSSYLARFEAEATTAARLNHPNIVHIYLLGCEGTVRFIAMEYVQGTNLREYILKKGALDLPLALSIMKQTGVAIGAAGEHGLIHRDIKPENILLTRKGQVKVADFGLCRDLDADTHHTQPGMTLGTPLYMSPEQAQGHTLDHRSDLYSLGVTFYHMLAGHPPFRAETPLALALKHVKDTPVSLAVHRPDLPPELVRLVMKLMEKDPDDRYQTAAEMVRDLARIRESLQTQPVAVPAGGDFATGSTTTTNNKPAVAEPVSSPQPRVDPVQWTRRLAGFRPGNRVLSGLVALFFVVGLAWGWLTRPPDLLSASPSAEALATMPALWMAPAWSDVPRRNSAEEQFHYAQLQASSDDQEAAWLAVPGYFPTEHEYDVKAYIQLARRLLREHDAERLRILADEIARWSPDQAREMKLASIIRAGSKALGGELDDVLDTLGPMVNPPSIYDPELLELSFEVTVEVAKTVADADSYPLAKLHEIQGRLLNQLYNAETREMNSWRRAG